jgi:predicted dehydrogenase
MSEIRFAVAGFKHFHILEFVRGMKELPGATFVGFWDDDPALRAKYTQEYGVPGFETLEKLVEATQPEIVGVADCNDRKADTIARLTELGCHVLADKPLVTTFAGLDKVEAAAQKSGKQIGLMLLERYNAPTRRVREEILSGRLGTLASFTGLSPHKLKPANRPAWMFEPDLYGGVLNDLGIHNLDLCRWLKGTEPVAVSASEGCLRFTQCPGFTDHAEMFVEFGDSSTAMLRVDWLTPEAFPAHGDGRYFFEGTNATIEIVAAPDIYALGEGVIICDAWDKPREKLTGLPPEQTCYAEFTALCRGAKTAALLPEDGFKSTRLALYAREAARTHTRIDLRGKL